MIKYLQKILLSAINPIRERIFHTKTVCNFTDDYYGDMVCVRQVDLNTANPKVSRSP